MFLHRVYYTETIILFVVHSFNAFFNTVIREYPQEQEKSQIDKYNSSF